VLLHCEATTSDLDSLISTLAFDAKLWLVGWCYPTFARDWEHGENTEPNKRATSQGIYLLQFYSVQSVVVKASASYSVHLGSISLASRTKRFKDVGIHSLFICSIFILLSRESDGDAIVWTNLHPLRSYPIPNFLVAS